MTQQPMAFEQALQLAVDHLQAGRLPEAERACRQAIAQRPTHPGALHVLGFIAMRAGRADAAVPIIRQATALAPTAEAWFHLGDALSADGKLDEAVAAYSTAVKLKPDFADSWHNLGIALKKQGKLDEAIAAHTRCVQLNPGLEVGWFSLGSARADAGQRELAIDALSRAIQLKADYADAYNNLGNILVDAGKLDEAIAAYRRVIQLKPDYAEAYNNLGNAYRNQKRFDLALEAYAVAIKLRPDLANAHYNQGCVLRDQGKLAAAVAAYSVALKLSPTLAEAWYALGMALGEQEKLDEAAAAYSNAAQFQPKFAMAHNDLGNILKDQGRLDEALACYKRASALDPNHAAIHSNLLYVAHFHDAYDPPKLFEEHRRWNQRHAEPLKKYIQPHTNSPDPGRQLRIGYISPDLSFAPVGRFLEPWLKYANHNEFKVFCYSDVRTPDALTARLRGYTDTWRDIVGLSDEQVAAQVREDCIDIAVDLTMHMTNHRLLVFARKPAPIQVTYLAYCSTTGLDTIDYRFTDRYLEPPGLGDQYYSERSVYLPESYWCYDPGFDAPEVGPLPAQTKGHVTFGCLNNFCKVSPSTLAAWCRILRNVPGSRFLLHSKKGNHRQRVVDLLKREGIDPERLTFTSHLSMLDYFQLYNQIDIGLDPFPWPGGTTTCDALWMGVPVVSLAGQTAVARAGVSILSNVGLPELVADSQDRYVRIATELSENLAQLAEMRAGLRRRMQQSPLTDGPRFARNIEAAYKHMWLQGRQR